MSVLSFTACSEKDKSVLSKNGKWRYIENEDGTITLSKIVEMESVLVIPETVDGKTVSAISEKFFLVINDGSQKKKLKDTYSDNNILEKVIFEADIKEIPNMAFYICKKLTEVKLPDSLEKIGSFVFFGCNSLTQIEIPENCKSIGEYAFRECSSLVSVTLKSKEIVNIGEKCFYMVNEKASGDDQYYIIDNLKITVDESVDYSLETLEKLRKETRNNSYKYWQEYVRANVIVSKLANA